MIAGWSVALGLAGAGWACGWVLAGRRHVLNPPPTGDVTTGPAVSVIVPVRNEASRLPRLLELLQASEPPLHEVIVVDDGSTDATAHLAREAGARVLPASPPPGWNGKPWACRQGAAAATGDVLVFLDADTEPARHVLQTLGTTAMRGELVSVQPRHRVERWYERLSAGPALISFLGAGVGAPPRRRWWRRPVAFGPAIAVRRDRYEAFGGHDAVRADVAEDLSLARVADAARTPSRTLLGGDALSYRMYPDGLRSLADGWSKNLAAGARSMPPLRLAATVLWVTAALQAPLLLVSPASPWVALAVWSAFVVQVAVLLHRIGRFGWVVPLLYPVALAGFVVLFLRSCLLAMLGRAVDWRGRPVRVTVS